MTRDPIKLDSDIVVPLLVDSEDEVDEFIHQATRNVYRKLRFYMLQFYRAMITRISLMKTEERCSNNLGQLIKKLVVIQETSAYKFLDRKKLSKSITKLSLEIQENLLEEYELRAFLTDERAAIESFTSKDNFAYFFKDYLLEHTVERERIDRECVSNILAHADQEIGRHSAFNIQLVSALVGAVIAVGLMYAGAYLLRLGGS